PQFRWVKSRLPRKAQPVPPIYQPEIAADAIVWAAHSHQREIVVGWSALKAILGNRVAPGYADHVLARMGYDAQMTDEAIDPNRPDNLWGPVSGDHGAHGAFDDRAREFSFQLWANKNRRWLALLGLGLATSIVAG